MTVRVSIALLCLLAGCSTKSQLLLDSDVPAPPDMENRMTDDIRRRGGDLVSVHAVYSGMVLDASKKLTGVSARFRDNGWTVSRSSGDEIFAIGVYAKSDRRCRVRVSKNELAPSMSRTSYHVFTDEQTSESTGGVGSG